MVPLEKNEAKKGGAIRERNRAQNAILQKMYCTFKWIKTNSFSLAEWLADNGNPGALTVARLTRCRLQKADGNGFPIPFQ